MRRPPVPISRRPVVDGDVARVPLTHGMVAPVDATDVDLVDNMRWAAVRSPCTGTFYAIGRRGKLHMQRLIRQGSRTRQGEVVPPVAADPDVLEALDFEHELPCEFASDDDCGQPAQWLLVLAIILGPVVLGRVDDLLCTAHKDALVAHLGACPNCPDLYRIESVEPL